MLICFRMVKQATTSPSLGTPDRPHVYRTSYDEKRLAELAASEDRKVRTRASPVMYPKVFD